MNMINVSLFYSDFSLILCAESFDKQLYTETKISITVGITTC